MYERSGSKFFITITGIQPGPDTFETLCNFRLVLEGERGKKIIKSSRLEFLEKFLAKSFALPDAENKTSAILNRGGIADLPLLKTLPAIRQKYEEPSFINTCKFSSFKNLFATIATLSKIYFRF